jgi:hypothetical protein
MASKNANIYDICDDVILKQEPAGEPGRNLQKLYKKSARNFFLKTFILSGARHPDIKEKDIPKYKEMISAAMNATYDNWNDNEWINKTFKPIAVLLDKIKNPDFQIREKIEKQKNNPDEKELDNVINATLKDIFKVWKKEKKDPWFPVAAQVILSGDDHMDGENFLNVLRGLGAFEYQNITMLFSFLRCFLMENPKKRKMLRKPFHGICEPMFQKVAWIYHRIAFSDVNFAEQLLSRIEKNNIDRSEFNKLVDIMENLVRYCVVTSQEWLETPNKGIKHPSVTCLPMDENGKPLCKLKDSDWQKKADLGFKDYVPDTDTTFLVLSLAQKWIDFVKKHKIIADENLLKECKKFLDHPWVEIINEYQYGSGYDSNLATIEITKPLDYYGAVGIWFHKEFKKPDGRIVRDAIGNEVCPGHNMDILESILFNRKKWKSLEGENLKTTQRFLEFHYRAFTSGNFKVESALKYYLPEIYVYYLGRMYDVYLTMSDAEKKTFDPEGKVEEIRKIAIEYIKNDMLGYELNSFDAALAVSALCLLRYDKKDDGVIATGIKIMTDALGEGRGHPYKPYEWNRMRHPTRILVGSDVSTSFFVMQSMVEAKNYLYSK